MKYQEIRIGALYPLTGPNAEIGQSIREALEFLVDIINGKYDIAAFQGMKVSNFRRAKVKLVWEDTEGDPIIAQAKARKLIEEEKVTSIIGSYQSTVTAVVSLQTEIYKIPYICPDADARILTERGLKWFFKVGPSDTIYTKVLFEMLKENGFCDYSVASLTENSLLGQDEATAVLNLARYYKKCVTAIELTDVSLPITRKQILPIKCSNPDFIFTAQFEKNAIETIRTLKKMNYYPKAILDQDGTYAFDQVIRTLGRDVDYVITAEPWAVGVTKKNLLAQVVNDMFKSVYGYDLNGVNAVSFTGLYVLIRAISLGGSDEPKAIREALISTTVPGDELIVPWKGVCFDKKGENIFADSLIVQIFNKVAKIVWPKNLAERNVVIPAPKWNKYSDC